MITALFCPQERYTGEFTTLHYWNQEWGWQVTRWQFGKPKQHTWHESTLSALWEILQSGFGWANWKMQVVFEEDVKLAGD